MQENVTIKIYKFGSETKIYFFRFLGIKIMALGKFQAGAEF